MSEIVFTLPILAGKVEAWRRFCQEISGTRRQQHAASRQRMGITHEQMVLIETSFGATAVTTFDAFDMAQALKMLITSDRSFDVWYRDRLRELHGVDLTGYEQPALRKTLPRDLEVHFEWSLEADLNETKVRK